jgi:hypothetical protein
MVLRYQDSDLAIGIQVLWYYIKERPWIGLIASLAVSAGGYRRVDPLSWPKMPSAKALAGQPK